MCVRERGGKRGETEKVMYPVFGSAQVWGSEERESLWKSVPFFRLVWSMIFPPLSHVLGPYSRFSKSWDAFLGRLFETFTDSFSLVLVFCTPQVVVGCAYTWHLSGGLGCILSSFVSSPLCIYKPLSPGIYKYPKASFIVGISSSSFVTRKDTRSKFFRM